jgi:glycosyltransferase involved in cell wall biosynthesis
VINHYAGSPVHGMVFRHFYLAREWIKMGHKVTIVAASFAHVRSQNPQVRNAVTEEYIDGIRYLWLKAPRYSGNGPGRILNILTFVARLLLSRELMVRMGPPDAVIAASTYVLDIFPAMWISKRHKARLIFEVRDLWPLGPMILRNMSPWHPLIIPLQFSEGYAYRKSHKVVTCISEAYSYMASRGMHPDKFVYIPNGIDPIEWESSNQRLPETHAAALSDLRSQGRFIIGYAGAHGEPTDLYTVVEAADSLQDTAVAFVFVGDGSEKARLQARSAQKGCSNVLFLPPVSKACVPALLRSMDALYVGVRRLPSHRFGVSPNKLFDYMMAAKPVIEAVDAENDVVARSNCGISIIPESPSELADAVRRLMQMQPGDLERMGARGKKYVLENHDYSKLAQQFIESVF